MPLRRRTIIATLPRLRIQPDLRGRTENVSNTESLCHGCRHKRDIVSAKGSRFILCLLSQTDRRFTKYPPQPLIRCQGYAARPPEPRP